MPFALKEGINFSVGPDFIKVVGLLKDRANNLIEIAQGAKLFYNAAPQHDKNSEDFKKNVPDTVNQVVKDFIVLLQATDGSKEAIAASMKQVLSSHSLKMPALAMPVRYLMFATTQTPAIDAVMAIMGIEEVVKRLSI